MAVVEHTTPHDHKVCSAGKPTEGGIDGSVAPGPVIEGAQNWLLIKLGEWGRGLGVLKTAPGPVKAVDEPGAAHCISFVRGPVCACKASNN